jgi:hypothetical protein
MPQLFRWQWLWQSRRRLLLYGAAVFALGLAFAGLLAGLMIWGRPNANIVRGVPLPVFLMAVGGYAIMQAVFSPSGAFGDHDQESDRYARRKLNRRLRRYAERANEEPIPLEHDLRNRAVGAGMAECPDCLFQTTVMPGRPPDEAVVCRKCNRRFYPA